MADQGPGVRSAQPRISGLRVQVKPITTHTHTCAHTHTRNAHNTRIRTHTHAHTHDTRTHHPYNFQAQILRQGLQISVQTEVVAGSQFQGPEVEPTKKICPICFSNFPHNRNTFNPTCCNPNHCKFIGKLFFNSFVTTKPFCRPLISCAFRKHRAPQLARATTTQLLFAPCCTRLFKISLKYAAFFEKWPQLLKSNFWHSFLLSTYFSEI